MMNVSQYKFPGVFTIKDNDRTSFCTQSLNPGSRVYGEKLVTLDDKEYRILNDFLENIKDSISLELYYQLRDEIDGSKNK